MNSSQKHIKKNRQPQTRPGKIFLNKFAKHKYEILETIEAGLVLTGEQVKSIRVHQVDLRDAFGIFQDGECFILNLPIPVYAYADATDRGVDRQSMKIKALLQKREIIRLTAKKKEKNMTLVVLQLYFNKQGYVKVSLGLAKGKKLGDSREDQKKQDADREIARAFKGRNIRLSHSEK